MVENFTLEMVLMLIAALCVASWLIGEMFGAWRMRKLGRSRLSDDSANSPLLFTGTPAQAPEQREPSPPPDLHDNWPKARTSDLHPSARPSKKPLPRALGRARNSAIARPNRPCAQGQFLPSLAELLAQAQSTAHDGAIWDDLASCQEILASDPHAALILGHYNRSIQGLNLDVLRVEIIRPEQSLPRFADAAPLALSSKVEEFAIAQCEQFILAENRS